MTTLNAQADVIRTLTVSLNSLKSDNFKLGVDAGTYRDLHESSRDSLSHLKDVLQGNKEVLTQTELENRELRARLNASPIGQYHPIY